MARGTTKSRWKVYFDAEGNHLSYVSDPTKLLQSGGYERPAYYEFTGLLCVTAHHHGRSSVWIEWKDIAGRSYGMFFSEFMRLVPQMNRGVLSGRWGFVKNGTNTGLVRVNS